MNIKVNQIITLELDSETAKSLMFILNGFRDLEINDKDIFDQYSLTEKEEASIDNLSRELNSISTMIS